MRTVDSSIERSLLYKKDKTSQQPVEYEVLVERSVSQRKPLSSQALLMPSITPLYGSEISLLVALVILRPCHHSTKTRLPELLLMERLQNVKTSKSLSIAFSAQNAVWRYKRDNQLFERSKSSEHGVFGRSMGASLLLPLKLEAKPNIHADYGSLKPVSLLQGVQKMPHRCAIRVRAPSLDSGLEAVIACVGGEDQPDLVAGDVGEEHVKPSWRCVQVEAAEATEELHAALLEVCVYPSSAPNRCR